MRKGAVPAVVAPGPAVSAQPRLHRRRTAAAVSTASLGRRRPTTRGSPAARAGCRRPAADRCAAGTGCRRSVPAAPGRRHDGRSPRTPGGRGPGTGTASRISPLISSAKPLICWPSASGNCSSPSSTRRLGLWNSSVIRVWAMPACTSPSMRACRKPAAQPPAQSAGCCRRRNQQRRAGLRPGDRRRLRKGKQQYGAATGEDHDRTPVGSWSVERTSNRNGLAPPKGDGGIKSQLAYKAKAA